MIHLLHNLTIFFISTLFLPHFLLTQIYHLLQMFSSPFLNNDVQSLISSISVSPLGESGKVYFIILNKKGPLIT